MKTKDSIDGMPTKQLEYEDEMWFCSRCEMIKWDSITGWWETSDSCYGKPHKWVKYRKADLEVPDGNS